MADSKITNLTALTGANLATSDVLEVTDISDTTMDASGTSKKITGDELAIGLATTLGVVGRDKLWDTKGDLAVATGADAASKLAVGTDGQVLQADSTQTTGVKWASRTRSVSDTNTSITVTNTVADSVLASQAIPITVATGDIIRLTAIGDLVNNSGANVNYTFRIILGATTVATAGAITLNSNATRRSWRMQVDVLVVATNDQRVNVDSIVNVLATNLWNLGTSLSGAGRGTATEDLTAGKNLEIHVQLGTATTLADVTTRESYLEVIKR